MAAKCVGYVNMRGKIAIITASSSGIGRAIAIRLAAAGASICLNGRNEEALRDVQASCEEISPTKEKPIYVAGDLLNENCRKEIILKTIEKYEKLDILINNVGGGHKMLDTSSEDLGLDELDKAIDINFRVPYHLTMLCLSHLIKTKGCVVNISSTLTTFHNPTCVYYGAAKSALNYFSQTLAVELGSKHVRVNLVSPGAIKTEKAYIRHRVTYEEHLKRISKLEQLHALKRAGEAEEVAEVVAFLASDAASFVTGSNYLVDGGATVAAPVAQMSN